MRLEIAVCGGLQTAQYTVHYAGLESRDEGASLAIGFLRSTTIRRKRVMQEQNKSVGWVAGMMALAALYFGWGFLAADYFQNDPAGGGGETNFFVNTITQLPNLPSVLSHSFRNRLWVIGLIVVVEIGVFILWRVMKKVEQDLSPPKRR